MGGHRHPRRQPDDRHDRHGHRLLPRQLRRRRATRPTSSTARPTTRRPRRSMPMARRRPSPTPRSSAATTSRVTPTTPTTPSTTSPCPTRTRSTAASPAAATATARTRLARPPASACCPTARPSRVPTTVPRYADNIVPHRTRRGPAGADPVLPRFRLRAARPNLITLAIDQRRGGRRHGHQHVPRLRLRGHPAGR